MALDWATAADDSALVAYVWCCRAEQAFDARDPVGAVSTAEAARRVAAGQDKTLRAWVETKTGRAYALAGNLRETVRAMNQATDLLAEAEPDSAPGWLYHFHRENLIANHGSALTQVGQGSKSAELLGVALERLSSSYVRERGTFLAYQADAFRVAGDAGHACSIGTEAVLVGRQTGSARTVELIHRLHRSLEQRMAELPEVRALGELLREGAPA